MRKTRKPRKPAMMPAPAPKTPKVNIPKESYKLLEYIESIGTTRSMFNLLRSSESSLKMGHPHLYRL